MSTTDKTGQGKKITLPSSGLAEEILAMAGEAASEKGGKSAEAPEGARGGGPEDAAAGSLHLVSFFLNSEEYALEIAQVQEIIRVSGWTRVPNAPDHVKGVINLRGRIIPVVDPKERMGLSGSEPTKDARIMVVEAGGKVVGLAVDSVRQVLRLPLDVIEPPPEEVSRADEGFIKGVGKTEGRLIILLDLPKVVGREEKTRAHA